MADPSKSHQVRTTEIWDTTFWRKLRRAIERVAGAAILVGVHWLFTKLLSILLPAWPAVERLASLIVTFVFIVVYFVLLWDIVTTFIPLHLFATPTGPNRDEEKKTE